MREPGDSSGDRLLNAPEGALAGVRLTTANGYTPR
jgi:hypothetical protein